jgi:tetratricopeptide (TPR) repeat protein
LYIYRQVLIFMKIKIILILLTLCFILPAAEIALAQGKKKPIPKKTAAEQKTSAGPLTFEAISIGLRTQSREPEVNTLAKRNIYIAARVTRDGVTFLLTPELEKQLRDTGATDDLIAAIRKANSDSAPVIKKTGEDFKRSGDTHRAKAEYDAAIKDYTSAVDEYKLDQDADIYYGRGIAYYFKGNYPSALNDLGRAIAL